MIDISFKKFGRPYKSILGFVFLMFLCFLPKFTFAYTDFYRLMTTGEQVQYEYPFAKKIYLYTSYTGLGLTYGTYDGRTYFNPGGGGSVTWNSRDIVFNDLGGTVNTCHIFSTDNTVGLYYYDNGIYSAPVAHAGSVFSVGAYTVYHYYFDLPYGDGHEITDINATSFAVGTKIWSINCDYGSFAVTDKSSLYAHMDYLNNLMDEWQLEYVDVQEVEDTAGTLFSVYYATTTKPYNGEILSATSTVGFIFKTFMGSDYDYRYFNYNLLNRDTNIYYRGGYFPINYNNSTTTIYATSTGLDSGLYTVRYWFSVDPDQSSTTPSMESYFVIGQSIYTDGDYKISTLNELLLRLKYMFPFGYFSSFTDILLVEENDSSCKLPLLYFEIPSVFGLGSPTLTLDPNNKLDWLLNSTSTVFKSSTASTTKTFYEYSSPYINIVVDFFALLYILGRFIGLFSIRYKKLDTKESIEKNYIRNKRYRK